MKVLEQSLELDQKRRIKLETQVNVLLKREGAKASMLEEITGELKEKQEERMEVLTTRAAGNPGLKQCEVEDKNSMEAR